MNNNQRVAQALAAATETAAMEIGVGILDCVPAMFKEQFPGSKALIVADENTWKAAGEAVYAYLVQAGVECDEPYIFTDNAGRRTRCRGEERFLRNRYGRRYGDAPGAWK